VVRFGFDGETLDTLPAVEWPGKTESGGDLPTPYAERRTFAVDPAGWLWFANPHEYVLYRRDPAGDTTLVIAREGVTGPSLTRDSVDAIVAGIREVSERTLPGTISVPDAGDFPPTLEALMRIFIDPEGYVVVFPNVEGRAPGGLIDVFSSADGEFLGRVELPVKVRLPPDPVFHGGSMYAVTTGEFDVLQVVRIDLVGTANAGGR
jgi:hypothetical protein